MANDGTSIPGTVAPTSSEAEQHIGVGTELGYYRLVKKLGEGGMGSVWQALHTKLDKHVAVKVLPATWSRDPALLTRFEREMKAVGKLEHPNIVRAMDAGEFNGTHYLVMEFNEGLDLSAYVKQRGPQSVTNACEMLRHAAIGLAHAHEAGLIHRDIKPSNLFLTKSGKVKILDLGLARVQGDTSGGGQTLTGFGQVLGTPDYMAPEQWENTHSVDGRSDLYALGCTLFYLLTGRAPFSDEKHSSLVGKMKGHTLDPIPDLKSARQAAVADRSKLASDLISDELDALYRKLMSKRPEERFASATELVQALSAFGKSKAGASGVLVKESRPVVPSSPVAPRQESRTSLDAISATDSPPKTSVPHAPGDPVAERPGDSATAPLIMTEFEPDAPTASPNTGDAPAFLAMFAGASPSITQHDAPASGRASPKSDHSLARRAQPSGLKLGLILGGAAALILFGAILFKITKKDGSALEVADSEDTVTVEITESPAKRKASRKETAVPVRLPPSDPIPPLTRLPESVTPPKSVVESVIVNPEAPIDFAAERQASERLLKLKKGQVTLANKGGITWGLKEPLPQEPFFIQQVQLIGVDLTDEELGVLAGCRGLIDLRLQNNPKLTAAGLRALGPLPRLKWLFLRDIGGVHDDLAFIANYPSLEFLDLLCPSRPGIMETLPPCPKLTSLDTPGIRDSVGDEGLQTIVRQCPQLTVLHVWDQEVRSLAPLSGLQKLKHFLGWGSHLTEAGIDTLAGLPDFDALAIDSPERIVLERLSKLDSKLRELSIREQGGVSLKKSADWLPVTRLANLEKLNIGSWIAVDGAGLQAIAALPRLTSFGVDSVPEDQRAALRNYTADDIAALRKARPDVLLNIDGKEYPATRASSVANLPAKKMDATAAKSPLSSDAEKQVASLSPSSRIVPLISVPKVAVSAETLKFKVGSPISPRALVGHPSVVRDLRSWSIEMAGHTAGAVGIAYSPDGAFVATVSGADDTLRIWRIDETETKPTLTAHAVFLGESGQIWDVAWSPDGQTIAVTTHFGSNVALYSFPEGRRLRSLSLNGGGGRSLQWSPDGRWLAVAHAGRLGMIDPIAGTITLSKNAISCVNGCWSPDGREFVTIDEERKLKFWNPIKLETIVELAADRGLSGGIAWSPDGRWIATGMIDGHLKLWDASLRRMIRDLGVEHNEISAVTWEPKLPASVTKDPNWPRLLSVGGHKGVVWSATEGKKLVSFGLGGNSPKASWSPDGKRIATLHVSRPELHDATTGEPLSLASTNGRPQNSSTSHVTADGKTLRALTGSDLLIFNGESGEFIKRMGNMPGTALAVSQKDDWLAAYDPNKEPGELVLIDTATYEQRRPLAGHTGKITGVNFSPDGSRLVSAGMDGFVKVWKASSGELLKEIKHDRAVRNAIWSPDGKTLATCAEDDVIRLFGAETAKETRKYNPLPAPSGWGPSGIAWSSTGDLIAIAPHDAQARVLDVKSGKLSDPFVGFQASMISVAWSSDGKQLLVGNGGFGGEVGYRALTAKTSQHVFGYGLPIQWLGDKRRVITGEAGSYPIQAVDTRKGSRLGVLFPKLVSGGWLCIGPDGHYRGSEGIESQIVYVALRKDGSQTTHSAADFASKFGWKNDPAKAGLLKLDGP